VILFHCYLSEINDILMCIYVYDLIECNKNVFEYLEQTFTMAINNQAYLQYSNKERSIK